MGQLFFKFFLSLLCDWLAHKLYLTGELNKLKDLVVEAKNLGIRVVPALVKRMLNKNMFLFGSVDLNEGSVMETVNQLADLQNARIKLAYEKYVCKIRKLSCYILAFIRLS